MPGTVISRRGDSFDAQGEGIVDREWVVWIGDRDGWIGKGGLFWIRDYDDRIGEGGTVGGSNSQINSYEHLGHTP